MQQLLLDLRTQGTKSMKGTTMLIYARIDLVLRQIHINNDTK